MHLASLSPETHTAEEIAALLRLEPLDQEGGFFRRTAESETILPGSGRRAYSVIYFLVTPAGFSAMHRLVTDEVWCFHAGDVLESLRLAPDGTGRMVRLGLQPEAGVTMQDVIAAQVWQGTRLRAGGRWALVSCVVAPEFHWGDFTLGHRNELVARYPAFAPEIAEFTR
jgi:uncharacterized protein